jgi:hypothetical protein
LLLFVGYFSTLLRREKRPISSELITFRRKEQMQRLREIAQKTFLPRHPIASSELPTVDPKEVRK